MRALGIDLGLRRIGLAVSDPSGTLARPLKTLLVARAGQGRARVDSAIELVTREIRQLSAEEDGLGLIVVGVPTSLDGQVTAQTREVTAFMTALGCTTTLPIVGEDERLTSREADERLALRERDWAKRKLRLDSAAAAIILQGYLDRKGA